MRYVAVFHKFFVDSEGFEVVELEQRSLADATDAATIHKSKIESTFTHVAFAVVEMCDRETVARKLTIGERLSGWLRPTSSAANNE